MAYDGADRPTCVPLPNHVFASYTYDADSRVTSITYGYSTSGSCSSPPTNLGNLTYTYDADSRIIGLGGSLAAVNLPPAASNNTYLNTNDLASWNGVNASNDAHGNVVFDPTNRLTYQWNERKQLSSDSSGSYSFFYHALGRREDFDDLGVLWTYIYDALLAVQANSNTGIGQNFFTTPGGHQAERSEAELRSLRRAHFRPCWSTWSPVPAPAPGFRSPTRRSAAEPS